MCDITDEFADYITVVFKKSQTLQVEEYLEGDPEPEMFTDEVYEGQELEIKILNRTEHTYDFEFLEGGTVRGFLKTDLEFVDFETD